MPASCTDQTPLSPPPSAPLASLYQMANDVKQQWYEAYYPKKQNKWVPLITIHALAGILLFTSVFLPMQRIRSLKYRTVQEIGYASPDDNIPGILAGRVITSGTPIRLIIGIVAAVSQIILSGVALILAKQHRHQKVVIPLVLTIIPSFIACVNALLLVLTRINEVEDYNILQSKKLFSRDVASISNEVPGLIVSYLYIALMTILYVTLLILTLRERHVRRQRDKASVAERVLNGNYF